MGDALVVLTNIVSIAGYNPQLAIKLKPTVRQELFIKIPTADLTFGILAIFNAYYWDIVRHGYSRCDLDKMVEEVMELIGLVAQREGLILEECLDYAYNQIKDRKGIFFNDVFIKEDDFTLSLYTDVMNDQTVSDKAKAYMEEYKCQRWGA